MNAPRVVVVGSLNMDIVATMQRMPRTGETLRGDSMKYTPGGKGANQAVGCACLSLNTSMIGCVGDDVFGEWIKRNLLENGVDVQGVEIVEGLSTGTAIISHTPRDNSIIIVGGANDRCTGAIIEQHKDMIRGADLLLMQLEIPVDTVEQALAVAKQAGVLTVLNPAPAQELPEGVKRDVDYMTPNETEWEIISGVPCDSDEALLSTITDWERKYGNKVIVTRGDKGCCYVEGNSLQHVMAPQVRVSDTTGAGDAFNAAMAYGLLQSGTSSLREILSFAVASASLSVQTFGAQEGMPTLKEVRALDALAERLV
jgi:ribokinase